jgi:hypothetical protein
MRPITETSQEHNNNNNNNNNKLNHFKIIEKVPEQHIGKTLCDIKELHQTATLCTANILREVLM